MAAFGLSDRQADDILEIRLRQLARLEKIKIEKELAELRDEKAKLEELLGSEPAMKRLLIKEIEADAKQYGDERRTLIQQEKRATFEARVVDEPVTVVVSQKGWVRALKGHGLDPAGFTFKAGDGLYAAFQCRTPDTLIAWGSNGRVYSVAGRDAAGRARRRRAGHVADRARIGHRICCITTRRRWISRCCSRRATASASSPRSATW